MLIPILPEPIKIAHPKLPASGDKIDVDVAITVDASNIKSGVLVARVHDAAGLATNMTAYVRAYAGWPKDNSRVRYEDATAIGTTDVIARNSTLEIVRTTGGTGTFAPNAPSLRVVVTFEALGAVTSVGYVTLSICLIALPT